MDVPAGQTTRRMQEWTPEVEMLTNVYDRLGEQISVTMAAAGARKPPRPRPAPRPKTAVDRVKARRREGTHKILTSKLLNRKEDGEGTERVAPQERRPGA
ncbi:MAG: hypothetical protein ABWY93_18915 [Mycobacterium sp.]